ncbi:efflux transporter periplasmic adaptor subunit, partial [Paraburkholderia caribensis]
MASLSYWRSNCFGLAMSQRPARRRLLMPLALLALASLTACKKAPTEPPRPTIEVTVVTVHQQETPVDFEFTAQTQSSREVEIRARVDGFLERRMYTEGSLVKEGQVLFVMDKKPFEAALQSAKGALAQQQARLLVTKQN